MRVQTNFSSSIVTPHSNHFFSFASQPNRCTGMAYKSSLEKIMVWEDCRVDFNSVISGTHFTVSENSLSVACCHLWRRVDGSTMQYSSRQNISGRWARNQVKISPAN